MTQQERAAEPPPTSTTAGARRFRRWRTAGRCFARLRRLRVVSWLVLGAFLSTEGGALAPLFVPPALAQPAPSILYVNTTDTTCQNQSPCYATIQAAVNAAGAGQTVLIQAGTYTEQITVQGKNLSPSATEADRLVITADPAAPVGSVVLNGAVDHCTYGYALRLMQARFVTVRGVTITGRGRAGDLLTGRH